MIPQVLTDHFDLMHIDHVFHELKARFGFNKKEWEKKFKAYLLQQPRDTSELDAFIKFGNRFTRIPWLLQQKCFELFLPCLFIEPEPCIQLMEYNVNVH